MAGVTVIHPGEHRCPFKNVWPRSLLAAPIVVEEIPADDVSFEIWLD